jgi:tryptophanyl-tRNA synthetase
MKLPLKVTVTTQDIKIGHPFEPGSCPIAKALRRASREHLVFACRNGEALIGGEKFSLPKKVEEFIDEFDHNAEKVRRKMPEFTFVINKRLPLSDADRWLFQGLKVKTN